MYNEFHRNHLLHEHLGLEPNPTRITQTVLQDPLEQVAGRLYQSLLMKLVHYVIVMSVLWETCCKCYCEGLGRHACNTYCI